MKPREIGKIKLYLARTLPGPIFKIALFFRILYKNIRMPEQKNRLENYIPIKLFM